MCNKAVVKTFLQFYLGEKQPGSPRIKPSKLASCLKGFVCSILRDNMHSKTAYWFYGKNTYLKGN